ncbi:type 1 glutamine amidotransferase [Virgibacillus sp. C22-A2]|uniref:Type 1 glutamine amidotransferase n=1 Tax=Virgibacillus tibetensis TaxID=3042313 RepID=A0ABU6KD14_9BACI|nr:type 1 glutamine amidotransferase [Virgibacillus sp. C22-A2]
MRVHTLINHPLSTPGLIGEWVANRGYTTSSTLVYKEEQFPEIGNFDMLIILGGTMGAYEEKKHPWLKLEKQFIRKATQANKLVLGICLGAQLIAEALGGKAYPHINQEIGWSQLQLTKQGKSERLFRHLSHKFTVFSYHGDTFDLPPGAVLLAEGRGCKNQAFVYGERVVGLQFHPEFDYTILNNIVREFGDEIKAGPYVQVPSEFHGRDDLIDGAKNFLFQLLDNMVESR